AAAPSGEQIRRFQRRLHGGRLHDTGTTVMPSLSREPRVRNPDGFQALDDAVELLDARDRPDPNAIERAAIDRVLAYEALLDAVRAQSFQQVVRIRLAAEGAGLHVDRGRGARLYLRRGRSGVQRANFDEGRALAKHVELGGRSVGQVDDATF